MRAASSAAFRLKFLSTPSARRATIRLPSAYPPLHISIHALREEGDHPYRPSERGSNEFLSTPSARRATAYCVGQDAVVLISIHALREEGDLRLGDGELLIDISIHALREEGDDILVADFINGTKFLSTPSARRAT